jgi:competence protein ComEC
VTVVALCAAALVGLVVTQATRPLAGGAAAWLLSALLAAAGAVLVRRQASTRCVALVACAFSLGAARGTMPMPLAWPTPVPESAPLSVASTLAALRESARAGISSSLPEPQASLAAGVLLGGSGHLEPAFRADLERSGLGHLLVIDGFKQVIVAAAVSWLATRCLGARLAVGPVLAVIGGYAVVSGGHPSAVRAALMVGFAQLAALIGRVSDPLTSLGLATLAMALVEPRVLFDVGLQLSVSATLGIVLLGPVVRRKLRLRRYPVWIAEPLWLSLAVTLGCLPVTLSAFQVVSLASPMAHVVAVPLVPVVLVSAALLALVSGVPSPPLVSAVAWLAWLPTSLLAAAIRIFGSLPGAAVATGRLPLPLALVLAGVLLGYGVWHLPDVAEPRRAWAHWLRLHRPALRPYGAMGAGLVALAVFGVMRPTLGASGRPSVSPLTLSRGQAVFVRGPTGRTTLIVQGRADARGLLSGVADHLALWEHKLDQVIVLDPGAERAVSLTLARYPTDQLTRAGPSLQLDLGAGQRLSVSSTSADGQLSVRVEAPGASDAEGRPRSGPTTFAARPGSAD